MTLPNTDVKGETREVLHRGRSKSPRDDSPPRSRSPPPVEHKKKALPMPAGPAPSMPRKARDVLASAMNDGAPSTAMPRRSIDALISEEKRSDIKAENSDDDELGTDFIRVCCFVKYTPVSSHIFF